MMTLREISAQRAEITAVRCEECAAEPGLPCTGLQVDLESALASFHERRVRASGVVRKPHRENASRAPKQDEAGSRSYLDTVARQPQLKPITSALGLRNSRALKRARARALEARFRPEIDSGISISLAPEALEAIRLLVKASGGIETGGPLVGWSRPGERYVTAAGGPGPKSERTAVSIRHDADHDVAVVGELEAAFAGHEIGHWHSHPSGNLQPSDADLHRACGLATSLGRTDVWIELVCGEVQGFGPPPITGWALRPTHGQRPWPLEIHAATVKA